MPGCKCRYMQVYYTLCVSYIQYMAQSQLTDSITKAVTAALDSSMSTATKKRSKQTTTQQPVDLTPVAVPSVVDGRTLIDIAVLVKQVLIEMQPFIERTIQAAVATAIEAMEKSVLGENERLTKTICDLRSVIQSQAFDVDRMAQ